MKRTNSGPPTFGGGRVFVEQELGNKDTSMQGPAIPPAMVPQHNAGGKFGSNLVEDDKTAGYNPGERASPGIPTHDDNSRFGGTPELPDKTPAYNPAGK